MFVYECDSLDKLPQPGYQVWLVGSTVITNIAYIFAYHVIKLVSLGIICLFVTTLLDVAFYYVKLKKNIEAFYGGLQCYPDQCSL